MGEIIQDGTTGFLAVGIADAVEAVSRAGALDRSVIRSTTCERFDVSTMIDRYVAVYRSVLAACDAKLG